MRVASALGFSALLLLLVGCGHGDSPGHGHDSGDTPATADSPADDHTAHSTTGGHDHGSSDGHDAEHAQAHPSGEAGEGHEIADHGLQSHNGEKWPMDDHTRAMFTTMSGRLEGFEGDLTTLGTTLQGDLGELIAGCTMTGAAHDELHKFLGLYMPAVGRLADAGQAEDLERIRELLELYPSYFE